jgi:hypothetical protein
VEEEGFYGVERDGGGAFRWTGEAAKLLVPLDDAPAKTLTIQLAGTRRPRLEIVVNGRMLFDGRFPRNGRRMFDLSAAPVKRRLRIDLLTDTFVPARVRAGSHDRRRLGVAVRAIRLQ